MKRRKNGNSKSSLVEGTEGDNILPELLVFPINIGRAPPFALLNKGIEIFFTNPILSLSNRDRWQLPRLYPSSDSLYTDLHNFCNIISSQHFIIAHPGTLLRSLCLSIRL